MTDRSPALPPSLTDQGAEWRREAALTPLSFESEAEEHRFVGLMHGLVSALAEIDREIGRMERVVQNTPQRATAVRARHEGNVSPLRLVRGRIDAQLRRLQAIYGGAGAASAYDD